MKFDCPGVDPSTLERVMARPTVETQTLERKTSLSEQDAGLESLCAIVNAPSARGTTEFGVAPSGEVVGLSGDLDRAQQSLSQAVRAHFQPAGLPHELHIEERQGKSILLLAAQRPPGVAFYEYRGRAFIREGSTTRQLTLEEKVALLATRGTNVSRAPLLRWQQPRARVEQLPNGDYRLAIDVLCSNEGAAEAIARVQFREAKLLGWGNLEFEEFDQGSSIYPVLGDAARRFTMKIRQPSTGAFSHGACSVSWSVVYTDNDMRPFLTSASLDLSIEGLGPARITSQVLDETSAAQRYQLPRRRA